MKTRTLFTVALLLLVMGVLAAPAFSQPAGPAGQGPGAAPGPGMGAPGWAGGRMGMGGGMGMGGPQALPAPTPVMVVVDKVLYVACDGKIVAFDAKTLKKIGEATYWERPERGDRPGRADGQGGPRMGGNAAGPRGGGARRGQPGE